MSTEAPRAEKWNICVGPAVFRYHEKEQPMTAEQRTSTAKRDPEKAAERRKQEKALDQALEDSFPASDPPAPVAPTPTKHD